MNIEVLSLGLLQGLTEFLPISSSGHLGLAKALLGTSDPSRSFDIALHVSTLLAVFIYFARDIFSLLFEWIYGFFNPNARWWAGWRFGWAVILGVLLTAPVGIALDGISKSASQNLLWLGGGFWVTALLLLSSRFVRDGSNSVNIRDGVLIGLVQGIAVMPGISRSGSTIWAGLLSGLSREEAFRFSFLLSIPTIIGAAVFDAVRAGGVGGFFQGLPDGWIQGSAAAFVSGLASLFLLRRLVESDKWWAFAIYCLLIGSFAVIMNYLGA
jgi:undecaprenyl-diphosphatase